jgi:glycine/D-amino acid oxidase-like deaminating enzyme
MAELIFNKKITDIIETDVLVAGGGTAGFAAAVAAARNGAKTLLIERSATLGGTLTSGLIGPFMTCYDDAGKEQLVKGIFDELVTRVEARGGAIHPSKINGINPHTSYYKRSHGHVTPHQSEFTAMVMDEMVEESGAKILFNTCLSDCVIKDGKIDYVVVSKKEGLAAIRAKVFIDSTGDADLAYYAGLDFWMGDKETGKMQPVTLFFEVDNIERSKFIGELEEHIQELDNSFKNCFWWHVDEARAAGEWHIPRNELGAYEQNVSGRWKINTTRLINVDATKTEEASRAMIECRKQIQEILAFMRKYLPGCKDVQLVQMAPMLGVRETRHILGKYELTTDDILHRAEFDDAVYTFGYAIDLHSPTDAGGSFVLVDEYYTVPYRSLIPQGCVNLLVAGRAICGSSLAAASFRVTPSCIAMGQAAGTAAAIAVKDATEPEKIDIKKLQRILIDQGAVIKNISPSRPAGTGLIP